MESLFNPRIRLLSSDYLKTWPVILVILVITSILAVLLQPILQGEVSSGLIFVLGITLVGAISGLVPALICAVAASIMFNFFLADPVLTFRISKGEDLAPPVIFALCALISGVLSGRLSDRTSQLVRANLQLGSLLKTSERLQSATDVPAIQLATKETMLEKHQFKVFIFENVDGKAQAVDPDGNEFYLLHIADHIIAGRETYRKDRVIAHRLNVGSQCVGALIAELSNKAKIHPELIEALASIVALVFERVTRSATGDAVRQKSCTMP